MGTKVLDKLEGCVIHPIVLSELISHVMRVRVLSPLLQLPTPTRSPESKFKKTGLPYSSDLNGVPASPWCRIPFESGSSGSTGDHVLQ